MSNSIARSFAGANTGDGFISFYDGIFCEEKLAGLYIIKGGPGTGKSTFMRKLGNAALDRGYSCEHYICGSDGNSLDGIIISNESVKVGVIDGTPPHPREFRSPGASGDILNFGMFWNSNGLREVRDEIDELNREKSSAFETAYRYLGAAKKIERHIGELTRSIYLENKAYRVAEKLVLTAGTKGEVSHKQLKSCTMNGVAELLPVEISEQIYLTGNDETAKLFLCDVIKAVRKNSISAHISRSIIDFSMPDSVYFPESKVYVRIGTPDDPNEKTINMRRFIDNDVLRSCRQKLRFGKKCRDSLICGAVKSLDMAKEYHFALEEIYIKHMDYEALEDQSLFWYKEILSRLD